MGRNDSGCVGGYSCLCACSLTAGGSNYTLKSVFAITWCHLPPAGWQISTGGHTVRASVPFQPCHFCTFKLDYWSPEHSVGIRGIEPECFSHICPTEQSASDWWGRRFQPPFHLHFRFWFQASEAWPQTPQLCRWHSDLSGTSIQ